MKDFWKVLKRFAAPYKKYLAGSIVLNLFSAVFNIFSFALLIPILNILFKMDTNVYEFMPWEGMPSKEQLMNNFYFYVSQLIEKWGGSTTLLILGVVFGLMTLLKTSCYFASSAVMVPLRTGIVRDIRTMVYNKLLSLPMGFFSKQKKGDIIARMSGDVTEIEVSIISSLDMLIKNPILIICYFGALIYLSWELTLFTVTVVPVMAWGMSAIGKKLKRQSLEAQGKWSETMAQLDETLGGLRVIKAFIAEDKMKERFTTTADEYRRASAKVAVRQASAHPVSELLGSIMIMIVLWFGGTLILSDKAPIDAPTFIFYMTILYSVLAPLKEFSKASYNIPKGLASMERVDTIMNAENDIKEIESPAKLEGFNESITFKGVSFSYEEGKEVLHDIDLTIPKGRTVALVGQSGSGKSTLVDLIPRYYDASEGSISLDGTDIRNLRVKDLRSLIGNVNQEAILFNDTFYNNITFGVESATMDEVRHAARIANADDFIMATPDQYQTTIGDRGSRLSGGQRQRISIARAILKNPPILILDEATSALDTESEKLVQEALENLMKDRTTLVVAHRLSTIRKADLICVLHEGQIVERGTHDELYALNGYYRKLVDMQQE